MVLKAKISFDISTDKNNDDSDSKKWHRKCKISESNKNLKLKTKDQRSFDFVKLPQRLNLILIAVFCIMFAKIVNWSKSDLDFESISTLR